MARVAGRSRIYGRQCAHHFLAPSLGVLFDVVPRVERSLVTNGRDIENVANERVDQLFDRVFTTPIFDRESS
jgi:hypothetical protein